MKPLIHVDRHSLILQMVLSFMALALLTAVAVGIPAILLIRRQVESEAWAQVDQGQQTAQVFYTAQQRAINDLARLTSQRPSIPLLLSQGQEEPLADYLETLQEETELDLLIICDSDQNPVSQTGTAVSANLCRLPDPTGLHTFSPEETAVPGWMLAAHPIGGETADWGTIIVGTALDDDFVHQMTAQTGLQHTLFVNKLPVASSLPGGPAARRAAIRQPVPTAAAQNLTSPATLLLNDRPYNSSRLPLDAPGLVDEAALDVADIAATERRLTWTLAGSVLLVTLIGSALSVGMARRIGRPLTDLTRAATAIQKGEMDTSLSISSPISELTQVSQALESARIELRRVLLELQAEKAWTERLLEAIAEGIVVLDEDGRITFFSPGAERITGYNRNDALQHEADKIFQLGDSEEPFSRFIPLPGQQGKIRLNTPDGRHPIMAVTSARLSPPTAGKSGLVLVLRDVSDAEMVHQLLGSFLANITHEFRTPLSALAASTELLLDQAPDLNQAEMQELLNALYLGIVSLQTLIDNLLESASLEAGRFRVYPRPADLGQIIAEATHMMRPLQDKYGQRLVIQLPAAIPQVQADARRTVQVLVNLLSNAIKYSPDNTEISLSVELENSWARVSVADRGPGVPAGQQAALFERFVHYGAENKKSRHGAGLGLSVVKAIIEAHGGQVGVDNRPRGGSIFWFTLPTINGQGTK